MHTSIKLSTEAFNHNIDIFSEYAPNQLIMPVIKANGYGHGLLEMSILCERAVKVYGMCVVALSEALHVRLHDIQKPILVLHTIDDDLEEAVIFNIIMTINTVHDAILIDTYAKKHQRIALIHIEIDTGLMRSGIPYYHAENIIMQIASYKNIVIVGVYTHMITPECITLVNLQQKRLYLVYNLLVQKGITIPHIHYANSGTVIMHGAPKSTLIRPGIGVYGIASSLLVKKKLNDDNKVLQQILQLQSLIIDIRMVRKGDTIGYDQTYCASHDMYIGLVPIGYADGYARALSNNALVKINDVYAPVIGRISMNFLTVDLTHTNAQIGTIVTLLDNEQLTINHCADNIGMSPYECATRFSSSKIVRIIV